MKSFRTISNANGKSTNYIMFGRELNLPDLVVYGSRIEEPMLYTNFAVDQQAILKEIHYRIWDEQWTRIQSHDARACIYKPGDFCSVGSRKRRKSISPKLEPTGVSLFEVVNTYPNRTYRLSGCKYAVNESHLQQQLNALMNRKVCQMPILAFLHL